MLEQHNEHIWLASGKLKLGAVPFPIRMVVARLPGNELWIHSPIKPNEELLEAVRSLGTVKYLISPNLYHHLFIGEWKQAFPEATMFIPNGLEKKRPDLASNPRLTEAYPFSEQIEMHTIAANKLGEHTFFHKASQTLIVSDLVFNVRKHDSWMTRSVLRVMGAYGRCAQSRAWGFLVKDKAEFASSLRRVLQTNPATVIPAHGDLLLDAATQQLESATEKWLV